VKNFFSQLLRLLQWPRLVEISKQWKFPGHRSLSLYDVLSFLFKEMKRDAINVRAAYVAFSIFISLFPTLLVLFTIIPFIPVPTFQTTILETMSAVLPDNVDSLLGSTIKDIVTNSQFSLLSISLLLAVYFSSNGILGLMNSFDKTLPTFRKRTFWQKQFVALKLLALLSLLLLAAMVLIIAGEYLVRMVMRSAQAEKNSAYFWLMAFRWFFIAAIFYFSISMIYFYGPAKHKRFQFFSAGSTLATVLALLVAVLFSWFINRFGQYNKLYGSIGTILVAQLWIYYNALGLLIGFELNASIEMNEEKLITED
jgi:membrane protein